MGGRRGAMEAQMELGDGFDGGWRWSLYWSLSCLFAGGAALVLSPHSVPQGAWAIQRTRDADEENLSAEQPPPRQDAWIPRADENQERPCRAGASSRRRAPQAEHQRRAGCPLRQPLALPSPQRGPRVSPKRDVCSARRISARFTSLDSKLCAGRSWPFAGSRPWRTGRKPASRRRGRWARRCKGTGCGGACGRRSGGGWRASGRSGAWYGICGVRRRMLRKLSWTAKWSG